MKIFDQAIASTLLRGGLEIVKNDEGKPVYAVINGIVLPYNQFVARLIYNVSVAKYNWKPSGVSLVREVTKVENSRLSAANEVKLFEELNGSDPKRSYYLYYSNLSQFVEDHSIADIIEHLETFID